MYNTIREIRRRLDANDIVGALRQADSLCQHQPRHARVWAYVGLACERIGKIEEARAAYEKALELCPTHHEVFSLAEEFYRSSGMEHDAMLLRESFFYAEDFAGGKGVRKLLDDAILFVHIPKCAGTSVYQSVEEALDGERLDMPFLGTETLFRSREDWYFEWGLLPDRYKKNLAFQIYRSIRSNPRILFVSGHSPITHFIPFFDGKIFTWIRNPVERVISDYFFRRMGDPNQGHYLTSSIYQLDVSFEDFAFSPIHKTYMCNYFPQNSVLKVGFWGIVEQFEKSISKLQDFLAVGNIHQRHSGKSVFIEEKQDIQNNSNLIKKLEDYYIKDMKLYEYALRRFDNIGEL